MIFGPVVQFHENSPYYSAVPPRANPELNNPPPHVTIEMPVYKELLKETIDPSVYLIKNAMQAYACQDGTSSIFIHDDGLQVILESERFACITFYSDHKIGCVACSPHDSAEGGYKCNGGCKKASNMNYGLVLSLKIEEHLKRIEAGEVDASTVTDENVEEKALQVAIEETHAESGNRFRPWTSNACANRMGEIIFMVDCDTIVPEDCFCGAVHDVAKSPEVAIIQHEFDVLLAAHHYFMNGIASFTRRANKSMSFACANDEVTAFIGRNAFLRWSAVQEIAFTDPVDGVKKIWSNSNVFEANMALRLQLQGYIIRWATYSEGQFKEGASLTRSRRHTSRGRPTRAPSAWARLSS
jgi:hypothetical protein